MIRFIKGIVFLWKTTNSLFACAAIILWFGTASAQAQFKNPNRDRVILLSVIDQFRRECSHVATVDQNTMGRLQDFQQSNTFSKAQSECFDVYLSQLRGFLIVYQQTCHEISQSKMPEEPSELARIFVNIRTYLTSFRVTHKLLNGCLTRTGMNEANLIELSDYAVGTTQVFKKLRAMEVEPPFKEQRIEPR